MRGARMWVGPVRGLLAARTLHVGARGGSGSLVRGPRQELVGGWRPIFPNFQDSCFHCCNSRRMLWPGRKVIRFYIATNKVDLSCWPHGNSYLGRVGLQSKNCALFASRTLISMKLRVVVLFLIFACFAHSPGQSLSRQADLMIGQTVLAPD